MSTELPAQTWQTIGVVLHTFSKTQLSDLVIELMNDREAMIFFSIFKETEK